MSLNSISYSSPLVNLPYPIEFYWKWRRDVDARAATEESDEGVKTWVKHVREAAYGIEDVIDEYMLPMAKHRDQLGFKAFLQKDS
ncbi:hypothetical protein V6N13_014979 [Hibiscus sabdariffa]|uniref:Disease resistance N-terminal domain-containing protein n=1 Tax=Hibiscus sabdariffa TaxID=183260 RepID=A0ABR2RX89_9ROSI